MKRARISFVAGGQHALDELLEAIAAGETAGRVAA
jgi:hypothetical protein